MPTRHKRAAQDCKFCQIIAGDLKSHLIFKDEVSLAFLDHRPLFPGHCLVVPREHHETLVDLPSSLIRPLFINVQMLSGVVEKVLDAEGTFVALNNRVSQSVPHLHIHVVPRRKRDGLRGFFWPRQGYRDEAHLLEVRDKLRTRIASG